MLMLTISLIANVRLYKNYRASAANKSITEIDFYSNMEKRVFLEAKKHLTTYYQKTFQANLDESSYTYKIKHKYDDNSWIIMFDFKPPSNVPGYKFKNRVTIQIKSEFTYVDSKVEYETNYY
jgi:hypothetical protein